MQSKKPMKTFLLVVTLIGSAALAGCWEGFDSVQHEPGIYKGPTDPLLASGPSGDLRARFEQGQSDR